MIRVTLYRTENKQELGSFTITGHANFSERGTDIVCAAVSTVSIGTVNSIETLTGVILKSESQSGRLTASVPMTLEYSIHIKVQLLLASMIEMLKMIEKQYPTYIRIQECCVKGGESYVEV